MLFAMLVPSWYTSPQPLPPITGIFSLRTLCATPSSSTPFNVEDIAPVIALDICPGRGAALVEIKPLALYSVSALSVSAKLRGIVAIAPIVEAAMVHPFWVAHFSIAAIFSAFSAWLLPSLVNWAYFAAPLPLSYR